MKMRLILALLTSLVLAIGCGGGSNDGRAVPVEASTNNDGSFVTKSPTAAFNPTTGEFPFPSLIFLLLGTEPGVPGGNFDLTLNLPGVEDPYDFGDPLAALNTLDGYSTIEKWTISFIDTAASRTPAALDPDSVVHGGSVRFFEVAINPATGAVLAIKRELTPGAEYVAVVVAGSVVAIIPTKPLKESTAYMAVMTNSIKDMDGNDASADQAYFIAKRPDPLVDANGNSTDPLLDDATAAQLEVLRQLTNTQEAAAATVGIDPDDIIVSWTGNTQSITPVLKTLRGLAQPAPTTIYNTTFSTAAIGGPGIADIYQGIITMPYYGGVPSASNPVAPLTDFWEATQGAYVAPFNAFGLDPESFFVTLANPIPRVTSFQTVPVLITIPNALSGYSKPAAGWPVVIFGHGLSGSRTTALAAADTLASFGYAVVAIDFPLHGITPDDPLAALLRIENTPFAMVANERTFDVDYINNATGAPGPDGVVDASGSHIINLPSLLTSRDNVRQGVADLSVLALSIPSMDINGDTLPDLDGSNIAYAGISWGGVHGVAFTAVEPLVRRAFLSVPAGGIIRAAEASPTFGPRIRAGLGSVGIEPGTADYELFLLVAQTIFDSADPINWGAEAAEFNSILLHEVIGDTVLPNTVATAPLSGTEPLIGVMGLPGYNASLMDPAGIRAAGRFVPPASHGSLLSPASSPAATEEMQAQMAWFIASFGTSVPVTDASTMQSP